MPHALGLALPTQNPTKKKVAPTPATTGHRVFGAIATQSSSTAPAIIPTKMSNLAHRLGASDPVSFL